MKAPIYPLKPYPPRKPAPPVKQIIEKSTIYAMAIDDSCSYNLAEILSSVSQEDTSINIKDINITLEVEKSYSYYEQEISSYQIIFSLNKLIDNPDYDKQYKKYLNHLDKYKKDMLAHKEKLDKYKKELADYEIAHDKHMLKINKEQIKKLEQKLKGLK